MSLKKNKYLVFLLLVLLISTFVRSYKLGKIPNGLTVDETDMTYNAYSIIKTGADVYGEKYPLFFQALDDYKPGLVYYSTIPAILLFGLNDFAVRFAPFVLGLLTLPLIFIITRLLYPKYMLVPYISTILVSFAPWHIALSRAMVWYIELIFLYLLSLVLFLFAQKERLKNQIKSISLIGSTFALALTLYVYYAAIIYLPLVLLVVILIYKDFLKKNVKSSLIAIAILAFFSLPAFFHYLNKESQTRLNAISVLTADVTLPISIKEIEEDKFEGKTFPRIIHNRRLVYASALLDNYSDYFNLDYLFVTAKNIRYFYVNNVGLFYLLELPFFFYGLFYVLKRREKSDLLLISLLVIGPIPASLTLGSPFPHRAILTILAMQLVSTLGATAILGMIRKSTALKIGLMTIYVASVYFFLHQYFAHSPYEFSSETDNGAWYSTVRNTIPKLNQYKGNYDEVVFTWSQNKLVPMVYFLFYNQVDPNIIQAKAAHWSNKPSSYKQIYSEIENIEFRAINWRNDKNMKNTLFVGYPKEFTSEVKVIDKTYLPNGDEHFYFVESLN